MAPSIDRLLYVHRARSCSANAHVHNPVLSAGLLTLCLLKLKVGKRCGLIKNSVVVKQQEEVCLLAAQPLEETQLQVKR